MTGEARERLEYWLRQLIFVGRPWGRPTRHNARGRVRTRHPGYMCSIAQGNPPLRSQMLVRTFRVDALGHIWRTTATCGISRRPGVPLDGPRRSYKTNGVVPPIVVIYDSGLPLRRLGRRSMAVAVNAPFIICAYAKRNHALSLESSCECS